MKTGNQDINKSGNQDTRNQIGEGTLGTRGKGIRDSVPPGQKHMKGGKCFRGSVPPAFLAGSSEAPRRG